MKRALLNTHTVKQQFKLILLVLRVAQYACFVFDCIGLARILISVKYKYTMCFMLLMWSYRSNGEQPFLDAHTHTHIAERLLLKCIISAWQPVS